MTAANSGPEWLKIALHGVQDELTVKIRRALQSIDHAPTKGEVGEDLWIEILKSYLPHRYVVANGIVIDSLGARSDQIDIVIYDRHYTPTLLSQQDHHYIPAEAVYAVFEVKPVLNKFNLEYAQDKAKSVRKLHRTSAPIPHAGGVYPPKPLTHIVAGVLAANADWSDGLGGSFIQGLLRNGDGKLDCGVALDGGAFDNDANDLLIWPTDGALMTFLFRLLARLQSLGTIPAIDWSAYASIVSGPNS